MRGAFNGWSLSKQLIRESGNIYSLTIPLVQYFFYEYKFFIDAPGAENGGWEGNMNATTMGNRLLDLEDKPLILPVAGYNVITGIKPVTFSNIKLFVQNHSLHLSNFPPKEVIQVFQINGKKILEAKCADDQLTIPLPSGIYILKIGNFSSKIIVN